MGFIAILIHVYILVLIYELFTEENAHVFRWIVILLIGSVKYALEYSCSSYLKHLVPVILCTILVIYSISIHTKNSNLINLKFAIISYGIDYVINLLLSSVCGVIAVLTDISIQDWGSVVFIIGRILVILMIMKGKKVISKIKKGWVSYIIIIATVVVLFTEQLVRVSYTTDLMGYTNIALACTCLAALFTILWLLDHHKMAKVQKMYEEDNRQMSQKLHRSKEILPMIANYVSNMDGTQDERMREKLEEVCHDYGKELGGAEMSAELFETTGIDLVNLLLRTKIIECSEQDIELDVFVSAQIDKDMKRLDVSDGEITRLLGDLLRNAIHAVEDLSNKMILLLIARDENGCVLIRIYDSGIPFPDHILERFGERGNTTWGTGNGLADLMETVNRVQASIEINTEMAPEDVFTKEISICFDGKGNVNIVKKDEK